MQCDTDAYKKPEKPCQHTQHARNGACEEREEPASNYTYEEPGLRGQHDSLHAYEESEQPGLGRQRDSLHAYEESEEPNLGGQHDSLYAYEESEEPGLRRQHNSLQYEESEEPGLRRQRNSLHAYEESEEPGLGRQHNSLQYEESEEPGLRRQRNSLHAYEESEEPGLGRRRDSLHAYEESEEPGLRRQRDSLHEYEESEEPGLTRKLASDYGYEKVEATPTTGEEIELENNDCYKCAKKSRHDSVADFIANLSNKRVAVAIVLTFATFVLLLGAVATIIAVHAFTEIAKLNHSITAMVTTLDARITQVQNSSDQQYSILQNFSSTDADAIVTLDVILSELQAELTAASNSALQHNHSVLNTRLDNLASFFNTTHQQLNNSILFVKDLLLGVMSIYPSCDDLPFSFPAGYYYILPSNGSAVREYCPSISTRCGRTGRWHLVANLDMTNSTHQCFSSLRQTDYSGKRLCARISDNPKCSSVLFQTGSTFSSVCGLVRAYQNATTDGFHSQSISNSRPYVDGVSITYGNPRQHIWTFAAARSEDAGRHGCPCMGGSNIRPGFVRDDYFCDTGASTASDGYVFYGDDPLWDGAGCGPTNNCCSFNTPPWFYKELPESTDNDIELRVCCDSVIQDEDIALEAVTIFVKQ